MMVCLGLMVSVGLVEGFLVSAFPIAQQKLQLQKTSATFGWKLVLDLSVWSVPYRHWLFIRYFATLPGILLRFNQNSLFSFSLSPSFFLLPPIQLWFLSNKERKSFPLIGAHMLTHLFGVYPWKCIRKSPINHHDTWLRPICKLFPQNC